MKAYEEILKSIKSDVSFGYERIRVYQAPELEALQVGYATSTNGEDLTRSDTGHWRKEWLVIGYTELCGDPIFIDTSQKGFPVYTAIHGKGCWEAKPIAVSLDRSGKTLLLVAAAAKGREQSALLKENPLSQSEKENILASIEHENSGIDLEFWSVLLS